MAPKNGIGAACRNLFKSLGPSLGVLFIANSANIITYLLQVTLGRVLPTEDFGIFNSINSVGVVLASGITALPLVSSQFIVRFAADPAKQAGFMAWMTARVLVFSLLLGGAVVAVSPWLAEFLHLPSPSGLYLYVLSIITALLVSVWQGFVSGALQHVKMNLYNLIGMVAKFLATVLLVVGFNLSYYGAIFGGVVGNVVVLALFWRTMGGGPKAVLTPAKSPPSTVEKRAIYWFMLPVIVNGLGLTVLTNIDLILVKHLFSEIDAGIYSGAAVIGRVATFLPMMLGFLLFPEVAARRQRNEPSLKFVFLNLGLTAVVCAVLCIGSAVFAEEILVLCFGARFAPGAQYLLLITIAMSFVSLIGLMASVLLAMNAYSFLYYIYICIAGLLSYVMLHTFSGPAELIKVIAMSCSLTLVGLVFYALVLVPKGARRRAASIAS